MLKYLRSFFVILSFGIFALGAIFYNFIIFPPLKLFFKGQRLAEVYSDIIHYSWKFFTNIIMFFGLFRLDIKNIEEIKNIKNKVIVATHPSFIDIVILIGLIPRSTCFVKKELAYNPILKNLVNSIFITNELELEELKIQSKKMLDMGFNLIIFPSGIRHRRDEFPKIKKGASLVALNAQKNIVPIRFFADGDFLFINKPFYDADDHLITFEIEKCEEIDVDNLDAETEIIAKQKITKLIEKSLY